MQFAQKIRENFGTEFFKNYGFFDINKGCRIFLVFCGGVYEEKRV